MTEMPKENSKEDYRKQVNLLGKKEFTFLKMQEYGFWPKNLPTPYERQENETKEEYQNRKKLLQDYENMSKQIAKAYDELNDINKMLLNLKKQYNNTWDYERIRREVSTSIMRESIERREKRKLQREEEKRKKSQAWQKTKEDNIVFIGKGYSYNLKYKENNEELLKNFNLPIISDDKQLAEFLGLSYKELRFLVYHRDATTADQYYRYEIPKKSGGVRKIAAPKSGLKSTQRKILDEILAKISVSQQAHGFLKNRSVITGAIEHKGEPEIVINMDLKDFFPSITFDRVMNMFMDYGYSGYIASMLAMLCTYCERIPIEVKGKTYYVKTTGRILPQGSPASPMITNIICIKMDKEIQEIAERYGYIYTRYADDISFSLPNHQEVKKIGEFLYHITKEIEKEKFKINPKKTRILKKSNCQSITGIVVNNKEIGVSKKWVKKFRALLYNSRKQLELGTLDKDTINQICGRISWLQGVNAQRYEKIIKQAKQLIKDYKLKEIKN